MAQSNLGINAGDAGDSFMDAPALKQKSGGSQGGGDGWNPVSAVLSAIGVHPGANATDQAIAGKAAGAPVTQTQPIPSPGSATGGATPTGSFDSAGNMIVKPLVGTYNTTPPPPPTFMQKIASGFMNTDAAGNAKAGGSGSVGEGANAGVDADISGAGAQKQNGSLGKTIMKVLSFL
jgi:hypothetical protein